MEPSYKLRMILGLLTIIITVCLTMSNIITKAEVESLLIRLSPTHDAYVPRSSFDAGDLLLIQSYSNYGTAINRRTFIKFDLSSIPPGSFIISATLELFMWDAPDESRKIECHRVTGGDWSEYSITWDNQPDATVLVTSVDTGITDNVWLSFDVTDSVKDFVWGNAANQGWRLKDAYESSPEFFSTGMYSKEYSDPSKRPYLEVKYYPPHLELELSKSIITAGEWVKMTVYRRTKYGDPIAHGNLRVNLGSTSTSTNKRFSLTQGGPLITSLTIPGGFDHMDFYYYDDKAGTWDIKVWTEDYANYGVDAKQLQVTPGLPAKLVITPSSFTMNAGETYSLNISLRDAYGFETTSTSDIIVSLSTTSSDGEFREPGTITKITSMVIHAGSSSVKVDYYDVKGGTWILTASAMGLTTGTATITVIPDTTPPVTTLTISPPKYFSDATIYVSGSTVFELSASDTISGVKETRYRFDSGLWNVYSTGFNLSMLSDGPHIVGYYSIDKAGNNEAEKTMTVVLDTAPPAISSTSPTGNLILGSASISFTATVKDAGSGVREVRLTLDGIPQGAMVAYGDNYSKTINLLEGSHTWSIEALDNIGNTALWNGTFILTIDNTPPSISNVSVSSDSIFGGLVRVTCQVSDTLSGVREVNLYYSIDRGSSWTKAPMTFQGGVYTVSIPPQTLFTEVQYYVEAVDNIGNRTETSVLKYTIAMPVWLYLFIITLIVVIAVLLLRRKHSYSSKTRQAKIRHSI